jgi:hypothetical protein
MCRTNAVEDEHHVLMECPAYEGIREELRQATDIPEGNMSAILAMGNQRLIAKALHAMRQSHSSHTGVPI